MTTRKAPAAVRAARNAWRFRGKSRPSFALEPRPGQRSVWDFPRPPAIEPVDAVVRVERDGVRIGRSERAMRVCETASPPTYYLPPDDVDTALLKPRPGSTMCEWKGAASYFDVLAGPPLAQAAWCYPEPFEEFGALAGWLAFMATDLECWVGEDRVRPQPGGYYGGWVTSDLVGPFKGEPGISG